MLNVEVRGEICMGRKHEPPFGTTGRKSRDFSLEITLTSNAGGLPPIA